MQLNFWQKLGDQVAIDFNLLSEAIFYAIVGDEKAEKIIANWNFNLLSEAIFYAIIVLSWIIS